MLHTIVIYLNQFSQQNYFKIPKVSEYSRKFPIFPQNSQYSQWKFTAVKIPGNFASLVKQVKRVGQHFQGINLSLSELMLKWPDLWEATEQVKNKNGLERKLAVLKDIWTGCLLRTWFRNCLIWLMKILSDKSKKFYSQTLAFAILSDGLITSASVHCFCREICRWW